MSHWRLALIAVVLCTSTPSGATPPTSNGPVSQEEGDLLWKDGEAFARQSRWSEAIPLLQRLVDRYPGHAHYIEAHLELGQCLLALDDPRGAIQVLRFFTSGSVAETTPEARGLLQRGRIELGEAYLRAGRGSEALLTSREIAKHAKNGNPADLQAVKGELIGARAYAVMGQDARAQKLLGQARAHIDPKEQKLQAEGAWTKMWLVERRCSTLPGKGKMDEAQARDQIGRRGTCLLEATVAAREALATGHVIWSRRVRLLSDQSVEAFKDACMKVPEPKGKRSDSELKKYRAELADILARDCAKTLEEGIRTLDTLKTGLPPSSLESLQAMRSAFAERLGELARRGAK